MLKTLTRHFFLLAVILGLAGQGVAQASTPCEAMVQARVSTMADMPACDAMLEAGKGKAPCKDMSTACFAMAGCTAVIAIDAQSHIMRSTIPLFLAATWPATPVLTGRDIAPDPDPPSLLG
jgi:hypothetical protein